MTAFPIAQREMLVTARSPARYRGRVGNSIAMLVLGVVFSLVYHYFGLRAVGSMVQSLSGIFIVICLFAGVHLTADAIAQEKREGTLGLLFLTPLTPLQIALGKLIACSLAGFYWLLILVPLLSLMLIVGGLQGRDMLSLVLTGLNTLFLSAAVGLFTSTRHTERKKAANAGSWFMVFFWLGIPLFTFLMGRFNFPQWTLTVAEMLTIHAGVIVTPGPGVPLSRSPWASLGAIHLVAWAFVGLATWSLRRNWQDVPARKRQSLRQWWKNFSLGKPEARLRLRQRLLDKNPFFWLASRERLRVIGVWIGTTIFIVATVISITITFAPPWLVIMGVAICFFHRGSVAATAAHQLHLEHEQGTLEMLLSTPLTTEQILRGQIQAIRRLFFGPVLLVLAVHALAIIFIFSQSIFVQPGRAFFLLLRPEAHQIWTALAVAIHAGMYLFDLYALTWTGMWCLTVVREARNAAGAAIVRIVVVPILILVILMTAGSLARLYLGIRLDPSFPQIVALWLAIAITNNLWWLRYTRKHLPERLRRFAMQKYAIDTSRSWLGKLGALLGAMRGNTIARRKAHQRHSTSPGV